MTIRQAWLIMMKPFCTLNCLSKVAYGEEEAALNSNASSFSAAAATINVTINQRNEVVLVR